MEATAKILRLICYWAILSGIGALILIMSMNEEERLWTIESVIFMVVAQITIASFVIYSSTKFLNGSERGRGLFKASIGALVLYFFMAYQWFWS